MSLSVAQPGLDDCAVQVVASGSGLSSEKLLAGLSVVGASGGGHSGQRMAQNVVMPSHRTHCRRGGVHCRLSEAALLERAAGAAVNAESRSTAPGAHAASTSPRAIVTI
jgi:hypothetical protein